MYSNRNLKGVGGSLCEHFPNNSYSIAILLVVSPSALTTVANFLIAGAFNVPAVFLCFDYYLCAPLNVGQVNEELEEAKIRGKQSKDRFPSHCQRSKLIPARLNPLFLSIDSYQEWTCQPTFVNL